MEAKSEQAAPRLRALLDAMSSARLDVVRHRAPEHRLRFAVELVAAAAAGGALALVLEIASRGIPL
jgi:hypothetical protein